MKRTRLLSSNNRASKVACTVSAAALMLGVSHATTVGLFFRCNYCYDSRYTGVPVSMTAFGVAPSLWENLTPMNTGYGCSQTNTLSQTIDTTTSTGGLNPLPNGSLTITWYGYTANFSGFAGYDWSGAPPPHYAYSFYGGAPPNPYPNGEMEVYANFMRDGVNFGPGSSGGDNNQPGYNVDITGLQSLFTSTPFAVELVATSDSMQYLTNAFIIDATANTTQSVVYPSTPPVFDQGDTPNWVRGHGGGLSTASSSFNTDHLKIIGNRAAHGGNKTLGTGYNFASTLTAAIITDKPVVSMSPQQVVVCAGDTVVWSAYAVGVPNLSYQWRKNGVPIPGETTTTFGVTNVTIANIGTYDLVVTNQYGSAISSPVTIGDQITPVAITNLVQDSNPQNPPHNGLNNGATWLASSTDGGSVTRTGVMSFNASIPSQITVAGETNFNYTSGTIMFWMLSSGVASPNTNPATLFDRLSGTGTGTGLVIAQKTNGTALLQIGSGSSLLTSFTSLATTLSNNRWHHVAVVYDQSGGSLTGFYIDGAADNLFPISDWTWPTGQELELGLSHDRSDWSPYNGQLDDVRYYNRVLSASEITQAYNGSLVDTSALLMQLNFTTAPGAGATLTWQCPDALLQSAGSVNGSYTNVPGAISPYSIGLQNSAKFFRYHGHTPTNIIANPYLM
jgi:hypothetical protein